MAKQKFRCTGIVQKTGQRVAVELSADSKEAALRIATEHGVKVEQMALVQDTIDRADVVAPGGRDARAPSHVSLGRPAEELLDEEVDGLLDESEDDDDIDLDLGDEALGLSQPDPHATKACPYCGEQILTVAIKCKHCGSYVAEQVKKSVQPIVSRRSGGMTPEAKRLLIVGGASVIALVAIVLLAVFLWPSSDSLPLVQSQPPASPAPVQRQMPAPPPATPEKPKASPEEIAYARKLTAFLDGCDETAKLLEGVPKSEKIDEQTKGVQKLMDGIASPPKGVAWADDAAKSCQEIPILLMALPSLLMANELAAAPGQSSSDNPALRDACRKAADQMRGITAKVRSLIPPACAER